jgi:hypothetical protein
LLSEGQIKSVGNLEGMPCKMDKDEVLHLERTVPENDWARNHVFHPMMIHAFACGGHEAANISWDQLPSRPKPNASNMHITSVKTKTADPNPQQPRY